MDICLHIVICLYHNQTNTKYSEQCECGEKCYDSADGVISINLFPLARKYPYHTFATYTGRDTVLRHALFGRQFNYMHWSGSSFMTYTGRNTVLRIPLVGMQ